MKYFVSTVALGFVLCLHRQVGCIGEERLIKASTSECDCPGDIVMYECTVFGGIGATTIWKSDFFQCSSGKKLIELIHRSLTKSHRQICNNGDIVGRIIRIEDNYFTSQLNVTLTDDIIGETIECISDNGTNTHRIGLLNLTTATAIWSPLPPENISWLVSYQQLHKYTIAFKWNMHTQDCHPTYNILASNCGLCPTMTNNSTVTCTDVSTDIDDGMCTLAIQTVVCGRIAGELSPRVSVQVFNDKGSYYNSSRISSALISAIVLGLALIISLIGFATVILIVLMKTKAKIQAGAKTLTVISASKKDESNSENGSDITTNKNIAYVAHSPKQI